MKLPVSEIKLNPDNPRTIKDDAFKKLVKSIKEFPEEDEEVYSKKINAPKYEPKDDDPPKLSELVDKTKTNELLEEINQANIDNEIKDFLRLASQRHLVFDYSKIAEYYAHADKDLQELFEKSALVIIDFKNAMENGFVELTKYIMEIQEEDYNE